MLSLYRAFVVAAIVSSAFLAACGTTGPDTDVVLAVSLSSCCEPARTLTVDDSKIHLKSVLVSVPPMSYETRVADADFIRELRTHIDLPKVIALTDKVDRDKLAVDSPLLTMVITYQLKGESNQLTKTIKFTDPSHDELSSLHNALNAKMKELGH